MSKKHKKRKNSAAESESKKNLINSLKSLNWSLLGRVFINFALVFTAYQLCLNAAERYRSVAFQQITVTAYTVIATALAAAYIFMNGGLSRDVPTKSQLSNTLTDSEKEELIEKIITRKQKAKKILEYLIPFIFTLFFDTIYLFFL